MPTILYVDDDRHNLLTLKAVFRREYNVETALSGAEGLEILASKSIDLIITDEKMPNMRGSDFLKEVFGKFSFLPAIIITGCLDQLQETPGGLLKDVVQLGKPWDGDELHHIIEELLAKSVTSYS